MKFTIIACGIALTALTACNKPEPAPVYVQPTYTKAGGAMCPAGYAVTVLEKSGETVCSPVQ